MISKSLLKVLTRFACKDRCEKILLLVRLMMSTDEKARESPPPLMSTEVHWKAVKKGEKTKEAAVSYGEKGEVHAEEG